MKPVAFDYVRASSISDVVQLLIDGQGSVKLLAGGQSLGPMLNLRMAQPRILIDITGIPELLRVEEDADAVTLGACITTANIEDGRVAAEGIGVLPAVAAGIAYRAVRNRGTIGGSICHADPAADWISALSALDADCIIAGPRSTRRLPVDRFVQSAFEVALEPGELLEAIRIPKMSREARWGYYKICRKAGEFATAIGAVVIDPRRALFRAVVGATAGPPIVIADARGFFGDAPSGRPGGAVDETAVNKLLQDRGITSKYARRHHLVALQRAFAKTLSA
jgi:carbon-monoxide dehydrogenase medium subunit